MAGHTESLSSIASRVRSHVIASPLPRVVFALATCILLSSALIVILVCETTDCANSQENALSHSDYIQ